MKLNVSIKSSDVKRLFKAGVKGKLFNQKDLVDILLSIYDRLERDYPNAMKPVYESISRKYQSYLSKCLAEQRTRNQKEVDDLYGHE